MTFIKKKDNEVAVNKLDFFIGSLKFENYNYLQKIRRASSINRKDLSFCMEDTVKE